MNTWRLLFSFTALVTMLSLVSSEAKSQTQTAPGQKPATVAKAKVKTAKPATVRSKTSRAQAQARYNYTMSNYSNSTTSNFNNNFNGFNNSFAVSSYGYGGVYSPYGLGNSGYFPGYGYSAAPVILVGNPYGQIGYPAIIPAVNAPIQPANTTLFGSGNPVGTQVQGGIYRPGYGVSGVGAQQVHGGTHIPGYGVIGK